MRVWPTRIAVTGGRGKLGRAVVAAALARRHQVVEIDRSDPQPGRPGLTSLVTDLRSYEQLLAAAEGCTAMVHLAAHPTPHGRPDHETHDDNVMASYHALSVAATLGMTHVCLASSINAIGGYYSRSPRYDYFPVDERHPTYTEDPYGLSKWISEAQADSVARRHEPMTITSVRLHELVPDATEHDAWVARSHVPSGSGRLTAGSAPLLPLAADDPAAFAAKHLWGYTSLSAAASACLLALTASFTGHEVCYVVAPRTFLDIPSAELHRTYYPQVPLRRELPGTTGFFDCTKAIRLLGWQHDWPVSALDA